MADPINLTLLQGQGVTELVLCRACEWRVVIREHDVISERSHGTVIITVMTLRPDRTLQLIDRSQLDLAHTLLRDAVPLR